MNGLRPCPYCGGEVDVRYLGTNKYFGHEVFSIKCLQCQAYVEAGSGFAGETNEEGNERIKQFKEIVKNDR